VPDRPLSSGRTEGSLDNLMSLLVRSQKLF
jgi:hypothetical protein